MRIHSIRIKMMLPIVFLSIILISLFVFMMLMSSMQKNNLKLQAEHYFEAISEVLNADRDIYQARLAQEKMLDGEGPKETKAQKIFHPFLKSLETLLNKPTCLH